MRSEFSQKLNEILAVGSKKYYDYLKDTGKGLILFDVVGIARIFEDAGKKCLYRLRLDKKLKSLEMLMVQVREKNYTPNQVKLILWDEDKKDLIIQVVQKQAKEELTGLENFELKDIKIVLDLKFLVERTWKWHESNTVRLPTEAPFVPEKIETFKGTSAGQTESVRFTLERGFSYVWGAPGTGKTRYVLTNAVLNLFRAGKRVLITAPTNNAIEQALACLIERFDAEKIGRHNIIRLGAPSKAFADKYPEACEVRGVSQIITAIQKQKELLEDILQFKTEREAIKEVIQTLGKKSGGEVSGYAKEMLVKMEKELAEKERLYAAYGNDDAESMRAQIAELNEKLSDNESLSTDSRLSTLAVIGCTVDTYIGCFSLRPDGEANDIPAFDRIFLDEAGYCPLAKAAALFAKGVPVAFLGDHFQLPPVCEADDEWIDDESNREVFTWSQSALHLADVIRDGWETGYTRYVKKLPPTFRDMQRTDLTETYRFGQNLLEILCDNVYKRELISHADKAGIVIEVINAPKRTLTDKKRANPDEADALREYLRKNFLKLGSAAILTPYKNQVSLLRKKCYHYIGDSILTVHGSQGREWDTVFLSVCDTTDKYFTDSNNLRSDGKLILNTAISRVKKKLIIVCDENYWSRQNGQLLYELIKNKNVD